jgi:DNA-binding response OmpR family regulator
MITVLIIDDEEDLCTLLKTALDRDRYIVDCVHNLADAEGKLENHPDIILLDNNLPDGSGLSYFQLHAKKFGKSCVVFITADSAPDIDERVDLSGIAVFIRKPFSVGVLRDAIKRLA